MRFRLLPTLAVSLLPAVLAVTPASAAVVIHDAFGGSDIGSGDDGASVNGGFFGFQSNHTPNGSSGIEANGVVTLIGDSHGRDSGYGLISKTGFSANQQLTVTWDIADAFLLNQPNADHPDLDKIVMGLTGGQFFGNLFSGLEISLENGGQELGVRLNDSHVTYVKDTYVSGLQSGWDGQSAVSVTAILDPLGFSIAVSTMQSIVSGLWNDQVRAVSYLDQLTDPGTQETYVFINHFGSDTVSGPPHHFTAVDSITVLDSVVAVPLPAALAFFGFGVMMMGAGLRTRPT